MTEYQIGVTAPPFHPWCRCTTAPYYEDMEELGERWARDEEGNTYKVPASMSYNDWKNAFLKSGDAVLLTKNVTLPDEMINSSEMPEDIKEAVKNAIEQAQREYDVRIDEIVYRDISFQGKIPFQFNPVNNGGRFSSQLIINSGYNWNDSMI